MSETNFPPDSSKALVTRSSSKLSAMRLQPDGRGSGQPSQALSVQFIFYVLRQWWKVTTPVGLLLAAVIGTLLFAFIEPKYEASSWLQIKDITPYIVKPAERGSQQFVQTQIELIRSRLVLGPALVAPIKKWNAKQQKWVETEQKIASLPELQEQDAPIQWLKREIQVRPAGRSELYQIFFSSANGEDAANVVNAITDAYFALREKEDWKLSQRLLELLDDEREHREKEIERLKGNVSVMTEKLGLAAGNQSSESIQIDPLAGLSGRLIDAEVDRQVLESKITALEELLKKETIEVPNAMVEQAVLEHAEVLRSNAIISAKQSRLQEIEARSAKGKDDFAYSKMAKEIKLDEGILEKLQEKLRAQIRTRLEQTQRFSRELGLADMRAELQSYLITEKLLGEKLESRVEKVTGDNVESLQLKFLQDDLQRAEEVHARIAARAENIRIEGHADSRVSLLESARLPKVPLEPVPYKQMGLGMLVGLCLPFALAVFWERILRRVSDTDNLEQLSNLNVIGEIACLPARTSVARGSSSRRVGRDLQMFEESIDSLRTSLVLSEDLKDVRVLTVTSAANNEGKTSVASQLAVSIARASGKPTLLIDGDMRSPDVHRVFEIPLTPGLAEVLADECTIEDAIVTSWSKHVHLIPAGRLAVSPHKLLGNGNVKSLLQKVQTCYRYIVIDTPPVLAAAEALVLAKAADASLICAMQDVSRGDQVRKACQRLTAAGTRLVGTVLNGVPTKRYAYRYGSYAYSNK